MNKINQLHTKICSSCGERKPVSDFILRSALQGMVYGTICESCRKAKVKPNVPPEDSTRSGSGLKIDGKAKTAIEKGVSEAIQKENEEYHTERDKDAVLEIKQTKQQVDQQEKELNHRETRKAQEKKSAVAVDAPSSLAQEAAEKEPEIDLAHAFKDTQIAGKTKFSGHFLSNMMRLGKTHAAAAFGQKIETPQTAKTKPAASAQMKSMFSRKEEAEKKTVLPEEDPLKYIEDNFTNKRRPQR